MKRVSATYRDLLSRLSRDGLLPGPWAAELRIQNAPEAFCALLAHEAVRALVARGAARVVGFSSGIPSAISVAEPSSGVLVRLPDASALLSAPVEVELGELEPVGALAGEGTIEEFLRWQSAYLEEPLEESADLRSTILRILEGAAQLVRADAAIFCSLGLELPGVLGRGQLPDAFRDTSEPERAVAELDPVLRSAIHAAPRLLYLPDCRHSDQKGARQLGGSAILIGWPAAEPESGGVLLLHDSRTFAFDAASRLRCRLLARHVCARLSRTLALSRAVTRDSLTGLYNRSFFEDSLERSLARTRRDGKRLGLLIVDIDDFKSFNTRFGYDGGDDVLRGIARKLAAQLRTTDVLARWGGEEFAVLLAPPLEEYELRAIAERLRESVGRERFRVRNLAGSAEEVSVTVSIGGSLGGPGSSRSSLWTRANKMLLLAKEQGKNRVEVAGPGALTGLARESESSGSVPDGADAQG